MRDWGDEDRDDSTVEGQRPANHRTTPVPGGAVDPTAATPGGAADPTAATPSGPAGVAAAPRPSEARNRPSGRRRTGATRNRLVASGRGSIAVRRCRSPPAASVLAARRPLGPAECSDAA